MSTELWNMMASDGASCFAHCFSILFGMLSGPDALYGLMFLSSFSTPSVFIFIDGIVDFRFMWVSGMLSRLPLVNTEENCFINICAFSLLWLTSFPFSFRGATPIYIILFTGFYIFPEWFAVIILHSLCDGIIYVVPFFFPYLFSAFFLEESVV